MNQLISDADVERALDYLRDTAKSYAAAKGRRILLEEQRKSVKAVIMSHHAALPLGAQEREAYAAPEYRDHLEKIRAAVQEEEEFRGLRVAAETKLECWRTWSANLRGKL